MEEVQQYNQESTLSGFLSYLVFEGHTVRVGLEMSCCIIAYMLFNQILPWTQFGVDPEWRSITAWFTACTFIILIDQFFLCRPGFILRHAYQLALLGAFERSAETIEHISPYSKRLIRMPAAAYHLFRAEVFTQAEAFNSAAQELHLASMNGAPEEHVHVARSRLFRSEPKENAFKKAQAELQSAQNSTGKSAVLSLEEGLLLLEARQDLWTAKRILKEVTEMPPETHFTGETTTQIARAGYEATRLWTGEAEEGLQGLNVALENLRSAAACIDTLRPLLASFYLERSQYLATHKEPEAACDDLRAGLSLCNYPTIRKRAKSVQEEIIWRYGKPVAS